MLYPTIEPLEARIAPASLTITGAQAPESAGKLAFMVTLNGTISSNVTVDYATADGASHNPAQNATVADGDYTPTSGTLTFTPNGPTTQEVDVPIAADGKPELAEQMLLKLSNPTGGATLDHTQAVGTILDSDTNLTVSNVTVAKPTNGTTNAVFTVSLSAIPANTPVTVDYTTADGTAKAGGPFPDYLPKHGTLTFTPGGPLSQTVTVPVIGDPYAEPDDQFTLNLSHAVNANLPATAGTATIQSTGDTVIGLGLTDAQVVEGNTSSGNTAHFTAELTSPASTAVTFTLSTQNGTAIAGKDFVAKTQTLTIPAGETSVGFDVQTIGNTLFEPTKTFFVDLTDASSNVQVANVHPIGVPGVEASAKGLILNDDVQQLAPGKMQWSDVDGDLVTLTVSKGNLSLNNGTSGNVTLVDAGTLGGKQLQSLDLTSPQFAGANVTITASKLAGFTGTTDGRVNVGEILGTTFYSNIFQVVGNDLGVVTVKGDLGRITAGDSFSTPALAKLDVYSLGALGTTTGAASTESDVLGPITNLSVAQDLAGYVHVIGEEFGTIGTLKIGGALRGGTADNSGKIDVTGRIATATIGKIMGGSGAESGSLIGLSQTNATIGNVTVLGDIAGGTGVGSGKIQAVRLGNISAANLLGGNAAQAGLIDSLSTLGNFTLTGSLQGADGTSAGEVFANSGIGAVKIAGSIYGGTQDSAGTIVTGAGGIAGLSVGGAVVGGSATATGSVQSGGAIKSVSVGKDNAGNSLIGGAGDRTGRINGGAITTAALAGAIVGGGGQSSGVLQASGASGSFTLGKNAAGDALSGGAGAQSGRLDVTGNLASLSTTGSVRGGAANGTGVVDVTGTLAALTIGDSLIGGSAGATALDTSGSIMAGQLTSATIVHDVVAGTNGGPGVANSGSIRADLIGSLTVGRDLLGNATNPVVISASALANNLGIKNLVVTGKVDFAEILAGYKGDATPTALNATSAPGFRGSPVNADASIGTVQVNGSVHALDVIAGATPGADQHFGTADDRLIPSGAGAKDDPKVYSQIASVVLKGSILPDESPYGIVAQYVASVKVGAAGTPLPLKPGPGNDIPTSDTDQNPGVLIGPDFRVVEVRLPS